MPTPGSTSSVPKKRKRKRTKKKKKRKEETKDDSNSKESKGKGRPGATTVALAPTDDSELDDGWADSAVRAPPPGLATKWELCATTAVTEKTEVHSKATLSACEPGYQGMLLMSGTHATVVDTPDSSLNSQKGLLASFDGKLWTVVLLAPETSRNPVCYLPSRNLERRSGDPPA